MGKDNKSFAYGERKTALVQNNFLLNAENFKSLPYFGPVDYRKELYKLLASCGFLYSNATWKNRFLYPERFVPIYENDKVLQAMESCLRVIMQKYAQDLQNEIVGQNKKAILTREHNERKQAAIFELLEA